MKKLFSIVGVVTILFSGDVLAQNNEFKIVIKDHKFSPQNTEIPAQQKVKLIVENQDKTAEEFESYELNREKIIGGGKSAVIFVGPLKPGVYKYFGEFNPKTAQGTITVK